MSRDARAAGTPTGADGPTPGAPGRTLADMPGQAPPWGRRLSAGDLLLGARLSVGGGRTSWTRLALTGFAMGMCVTLLLLAASIGHAKDARNARAMAIQPAMLADVGPGTSAGSPRFEAHAFTVHSGDLAVSGTDVAALGAQPPPPPGVTSLPGPGQLVVSPALGRLLASPAGDGLRPRITGTLVGTIAPSGLIDPGDLRFYRGIDPTPGASQIAVGWGVPWGEQLIDETTTTVLITGITVLIVPLLLFVALAARLGDAARNRRSAAMRLVGASAAQVRRITAGEALVGSLAGLVIGGAAFAAARSLAGDVTVAGRSFFPSDVTPNPVLAAVIVVLAPALAVGAAFGGLRSVVAEPLGVTRMSTRRPRRLGWRLAVVAVAAFMLSAGARWLSGPAGLAPALALALVCIPVFTPYLIERIARHLPDRTPAWQLARGRLATDAATAGRVAGGIAVVLAAAVTLVPLLDYQNARAEQAGGPVTAMATIQVSQAPRGAVLDTLDRVSGALPASVPVYAGSGVTVRSGGTGEPLLIARCPAIVAAAVARTCSDGDAFAVDWWDAPAPGPGEEVTVGSDQAGTAAWRLPDSFRTVPAGTAGPVFSGLLATPGALPPQVGALVERTDYVWLAFPSTGLSPGQLDAVRNALAPYGWRVNDSNMTGRTTGGTLAMQLQTVRTGLLVGGGLILLLAVLSLLVQAVEQITERRRPFTLAVAAGVPRSLLARSLMIGAAVPALIAFVIADLVGIGITVALQPLVGPGLRISPGATAALTAAGLALVLVVMAAVLPALRRLTRPGALRTE